jgi:hypothetical protein
MSIESEPEKIATLEDVESYLHGNPDDGLIAEYLGIESTGDITNLASKLAAGESFDANRLVAMAEELLSHAKSRLWDKRKRLASEMNYASLLKLGEKLDIARLDDLFCDESREKWHDPVAGPIVQCLVERENWVNRWMCDGLDVTGLLEWDYSDEIRAHFTVENPDEVIAEADHHTALRLTQLTCFLVPALRWATNEPKVAQDCLKSAFLDLLRITPSEPVILRYKGAIMSHLGLMPEPKNRGLSDEESFPSKKEYESLQRIRQKFRPGKELPDLADYYADLAYRQCWSGILTKAQLAWLYVNFQPFWKKNKKFYLKAASAVPAEISEIKRKAAEEKHAIEVRKKCEEYIRAFFEYLQGRRESIPEKTDHRDELFKKFAEQHGIPEKRQPEVVDLFEILHTHHDESPKAILDRLKISRYERFKALPELEQGKRRKRMTPPNRAVLAMGKIPLNLRSFNHLGEDDVAGCLKLWMISYQKTCVGKASKKK